jgi:hypothetical protein
VDGPTRLLGPAVLLRAADAAQPPWLAITLAVLVLLGACVPAVVEWIKRRRPDPPPPVPAAPQQADAALALVQDALDDYQARLTEATQRIARVEAERDALRDELGQQHARRLGHAPHREEDPR